MSFLESLNEFEYNKYKENSYIGVVNIKNKFTPGLSIKIFENKIQTNFYPRKGLLLTTSFMIDKSRKFINRVIHKEFHKESNTGRYHIRLTKFIPITKDSNIDGFPLLRYTGLFKATKKLIMRKKAVKYFIAAIVDSLDIENKQPLIQTLNKEFAELDAWEVSDWDSNDYSHVLNRKLLKLLKAITALVIRNSSPPYDTQINMIAMSPALYTVLHSFNIDIPEDRNHIKNAYIEQYLNYLHEEKSTNAASLKVYYMVVCIYFLYKISLPEQFRKFIDDHLLCDIIPDNIEDRTNKALNTLPIAINSLFDNHFSIFDYKRQYYLFYMLYSMVLDSEKENTEPPTKEKYPTFNLSNIFLMHANKSLTSDILDDIIDNSIKTKSLIELDIVSRHATGSIIDKLLYPYNKMNRYKKGIYRHKAAAAISDIIDSDIENLSAAGIVTSNKVV